MNIIYLLIILLIILLLVIFYNCSNEKFTSYTSTLQASLNTIIGNTSTTIVKLSDTNTTNVRKLIGNSNQTIVLIHNSPFDQQIWYPLFAYTQQLVNMGLEIPTLICYDLTGHGTSWEPVPSEYNTFDKNKYYWSIQNFTKDLKTIYDETVGGGKITLVGYGFGCLVGIQFALDFKNLVDGLYILNNAIGPTETTILDEYNYLVNWINTASKNITYLTMDQPFIQHRICLWFELNDITKCPYQENRTDTNNVYNSVEYLLAEKMMREASATTHLQIGKLERTLDYRKPLADANLNFPITQLIAERDVYTNVRDMKNDFNMYLKKATGNATLYITSGKHGFPLSYPSYIYDLITGKDMSSNRLTIEKMT
jgi:pimeloyl-ACP methyl ester carboxylesterase